MFEQWAASKVAAYIKALSISLDGSLQSLPPLVYHVFDNRLFRLPVAPSTEPSHILASSTCATARSPKSSRLIDKVVPTIRQP